MPELDSLRGLAALAVCLGHSVLLLADFGQEPVPVVWLSFTPLVMFWSTSPAVLLFFVLSGFVLAIPFYGERKPLYWAFVVKRVLRIYPALWAVLGIDLVLESLIRPHAVTLSTWWWSAPIRLGEVIQHLLLVGKPTNSAYDPVIWSLVQEMRISLVLPLIAWLIARGYGRLMLTLGLPVALVGFLFGYDSVGLIGTAYYGYIFTWGAYLGYHRQALVSWLGRQRSVRVAALVALAVCGYLAMSPLPTILLPVRALETFGPWLNAAGAAILLLVGLAVPLAGRLLRLAPLRFLGAISYSLYLIHVVILYSLMYRWHPGGIPAVVPALLVAPGLSIVVAWLLYMLIERPGIRVGHSLALRLSRPHPTLAEATAQSARAA